MPCPPGTVFDETINACIIKRWDIKFYLMLIKGTFLLVLCSSNNVNLLGSLNTENDQLYTHFDTCTQIDLLLLWAISNFTNHKAYTEYINKPLFREKYHIYKSCLPFNEIFGIQTGIPEENNGSVAKAWQTLSHDVVSSTPHNTDRNRTHNFSGNSHWWNWWIKSSNNAITLTMVDFSLCE
jgi:hypothetical protein